VVVFSHVSGGLDQTIKGILDDGGVPFLQGTRESLGAIENLFTYAEHARRMKKTLSGDGISPDNLEALKADVQMKEGVLGYDDCRLLVGAYGIHVPEGAMAGSEDEAAAVAQKIGYPVVMKGQSSQVPHKTEAGLVRVGIENETVLRKTYAEMVRNIAAYDPEAELEGILVQRMIPADSVETIIGIVDDAAFGPGVVLGLGGIFVELLKDATLRLPPVSRHDARMMIADLKGRQILDGFRGSPASDKEALMMAIVQIGQLATDFSGMITSLDINPLMVLPEGQGVVAADILIEMSPMAHRKTQQ
jgi:acetyltransferase